LLSPANPLKAFARPENAANCASAVSLDDFTIFLLPSISMLFCLSTKSKYFSVYILSIRSNCLFLSFLSFISFAFALASIFSFFNANNSFAF